jgi:hypothetical protein
MSSKTNGFAQGTVLKVAYSMLGVTSCVVLARAGFELSRQKRLTASDALVYFSYACFATMCALYIALSPYMQRLYDVGNGVIPPYPELAQDNVKMTKMVFAAPCMFWMTLWAVKFSLLLLYRRLLVGLQRRYTVIWWGIVGICVVVSPSVSNMSERYADFAAVSCRQLRVLLPILRYNPRILDRRLCKFSLSCFWHPEYHNRTDIYRRLVTPPKTPS